MSIEEQAKEIIDQLIGENGLAFHLRKKDLKKHEETVVTYIVAHCRILEDIYKKTDNDTLFSIYDKAGLLYVLTELLVGLGVLRSDDVDCVQCDCVCLQGAVKEKLLDLQK